MSTTIALDRPERADIRALIAEHLVDMHDVSPPGSVHALDVSELIGADVTFWSARRDDGVLLGVVALKSLSVGGEIKSMRTTSAARGTGIGRTLLEHAITQAEGRGWPTLWLETGAQDYFVPARSLYASRGFVECAAFEGYLPDPASTFMCLNLRTS